jgi:two-component system alkaline phosphatase synthesis response regulator PhoP
MNERFTSAPQAVEGLQHGRHGCPGDSPLGSFPRAALPKMLIPVSLHAHASEPGTRAPDGLADSSSPAQGSPAVRPRVLVIDDSALVREAAKLALEASGACEVLVAEGGEQGIELAQSERPDAILLDVVMPGLDGITVAERLRTLPATSSSAIVFLTAKDCQEDRARYEGVSATGLIAKPFEIERLADELASLLGWAQ